MRRLALRTTLFASAALFGAALPAESTADAVLYRPQIPDESCLFPQDGAGGSSAATPAPPPVLVDGLGFAGIEADSADPEARAWFAQGVRLIWAFDEVEAVRAFREAQRLDPNCALCFFGEAWARGPTINLQPRTEELAAARAAARRANVLAAGKRINPRDLALIIAMMTRTGETAFENEAYADLMERMARDVPNDDVIAVMAADARMTTWGDGRRREGTTPQRLLERVLARNPDHSGAIHFYIHLTDWIDRQDLAERYADRLGRIAPAASHLVHMPSHTFYGIGRYRDAAAVNVAAIAADAAYERRVGPPASDYRTGLLAHNMHFAIESALARGDGATALAVSAQYRERYLDESASMRFRFLGSAGWYSHGLHSPIAEVLAIAEPDRAFDKAMRHYARGEALARRGDAAGVRAEAAAIARLRGGTDSPGLGPAGTPLAEVVQYVLEGRAFMLAGDHAAAEAAYHKAMQRQLRSRFGNDPPVFWYSVRRSLAAARLAGGDARGARAHLQASLRRWPNDPLALYALSLAERRLGRAAEADRALAQARSIWAGRLDEVPLSRI